ncbi:hypothetical protein QRD86_03395 [Bacillus halotolerans]|nr:hypothetical protein [Bacillus halotolerans]WJE43671.1 hypothetical protein QRD86_03395 [Bacillus halotolerans]
MARCTSCNYKWKAKEVWSLGFSKKGTDCPNCGIKQYISSETQRTFTLGYLSLIFIVIFPFIIKLSDKDESFFP